MPNNTNNKSRRIKGRFIALPHFVINDPKFLELSPGAVKLLIDIAEQFNLKNNGDLCAAFSIMRRRGWKSKDTLNRKLRELIDAGFIQQTRQGGLNNGPNLYAITWKPIDECLDKRGNHKLDVSPTKEPSNLWRVMKISEAA